MKDFRIFTDSTADLSQQLVDELDVTVVPTEFFIGGKTYLDYPDAREMDKKTFYNMVKKGELPKTAVINPERFYTYFEPVVKSGVDILHLVFSSGLTTTMQNSLIAAEELKEKYPESNIVVVDTKSASMGEGLLVYYAAKMKKAGKSMDDIVKWVEDNRDTCAHWFTVDDLNHLRRGGRVTLAAAAVGGVLNIKPILHCNIEGQLEPVEKVRGRKAALEFLLNKVKETAIDVENNIIFIAHADSADEAEWLAGQIKEQCGAKNIHINFIGPVIGAHAGPGAIGVLFLATEK